ncbi:MAG: FAD-dependent oxidoreductase [Spirochaetales bacterium]
MNVITSDVLVVGAGCSGVGAAIEAARSGKTVTIVESTHRVGGTLTAAGVSAVDGGERLAAGIWGEFRERLLRYYGGEAALRTGWVSNTCFEPWVGEQVLRDMLAEHESISVVYGCYPVNVSLLGERLESVSFRGTRDFTVAAPITIEAEETGELLRLLPVESRCGRESRIETGESGAPEQADRAMQDITWVATLPYPVEEAGGSNELDRQDEADIPREFRGILDTSDGGRRTWRSFFEYGRLPNGWFMLNWPTAGNDYASRYVAMGATGRRIASARARRKTRRLAEWLCKRFSLRRTDTENGESPVRYAEIPYIRESRRLVNVAMLRTTSLIGAATDGLPEGSRARREAVAVCDYPADVHMDAKRKARATLPDLPAFSIPLSSLIPDEIDGLIVAEKSFSASHLVSAATRVQPTAIGVGQAAGALAAQSIERRLNPRSVAVGNVQDRLLASGALILPFSDLPGDHPAFAALQKAAVRERIYGRSIETPWVNETRIAPDDRISDEEIGRLFGPGRRPRIGGRLGRARGRNRLTRGEAAVLWDEGSYDE